MSWTSSASARARAGQSAASAILVREDDRPAPPLRRREARWPVTVFVIASLVVHAGAVALALHYMPEPLASIGTVSISVDIVLGSETQAGLAATPSPSQVASPASSGETQPSEIPETAAKPETPPQQVAVAPVEPAPAPPDAIPEPKIEAVVPEPKVEERTSEPARQEAAPVSAPSAASSGVGIGRSEAPANYSGRVAAHLTRHQQYPEHARRRFRQGRAIVAFTLEGGGRVKDVSLVRSSGIEALDRESLDLVRRASPFPAPPQGREVTFTAPVNFNLR